MAAHLVKTNGEIEEEIRRRAQGAADAHDEGIVIHKPSVVPTPEPTIYGSHWVIMSIREPGIGFVEKAAVQVAKIWDIRRA